MAPVASTTSRARTCHSRSRGRLGVGEEVGLGQPFAEADEILRVVAERLRARHEADIGRRAQAVQRLGEPLGGGLAVDGRARLGDERAAGRGLLVAEDDVGAALGRRARRGEAGGTGADDQHVAMGEGAVHSGPGRARAARCRARRRARMIGS